MQIFYLLYAWKDFIHKDLDLKKNNFTTNIEKLFHVQFDTWVIIKRNLDRKAATHRKLALPNVIYRYFNDTDS